MVQPRSGALATPALRAVDSQRRLTAIGHPRFWHLSRRSPHGRPAHRARAHRTHGHAASPHRRSLQTALSAPPQPLTLTAGVHAPVSQYTWYRPTRRNPATHPGRIRPNSEEPRRQANASGRRPTHAHTPQHNPKSFPAASRVPPTKSRRNSVESGRTLGNADVHLPNEWPARLSRARQAAVRWRARIERLRSSNWERHLRVRSKSSSETRGYLVA